MNALFGALSFLNPLAFWALPALPVLYVLLKLMPPAPQTMIFPPLRFLKDLTSHTRTPARTPWWIVLLRLLLLLLLIFAGARPVLNATPPLTQSGPLRLVIDTDWSSAAHWSAITAEAQKWFAMAQKEQRRVSLMTTAEDSQSQTFFQERPVTQADLKALRPHPWFSDLNALKPDPAFRGTTIWLSGGLEQDGQNALAKTLARQGPLLVIIPEEQTLPLILEKPEHTTTGLRVRLDGPRNVAHTGPITLQFLDRKNHIIDEETDTPSGTAFPFTQDISLPDSLRKTVAGYRIAGQQGAQALYLTDGGDAPKTVAIVTDTAPHETQALGADAFYLSKALEPYATVLTGPLPTLLPHHPAVIILPDIGAMPETDLNALDTWVRQGGLLLRFAGPRMTQATQPLPLTPVPLRTHSRTMAGRLSWDTAQPLNAFEKTSPFYGIPVPPDVTVRGQLLAEPTPDLAMHTWATLRDGTPFITGTSHEAGLLLMIHTTAGPAWSTLPLSGLYIPLLKRIVKLSNEPAQAARPQNGLLRPIRLLDGFGQFQTPAPETLPIDSIAFEKTPPSPAHPPGFYGQTHMQSMRNLSSFIPQISALKTLPEATTFQTYRPAQEQELFPALLCGAFFLLLLDTGVLLVLSFQNPAKIRTALVLLLCLLPWQGTHATEPASLPYAERLSLAFLLTGNAALDTQSRKGLENLSAILRDRTSAEVEHVVGVDPAHDPLVFFPLIYWPVTPAQGPLSSEALQNLQSYLDHGGILLIDTKDGAHDLSMTRASGLQALNALDIKPLIPLPKDHVLGKSFYLLKDFPGRYTGTPLWVEGQSTGGRDGVSSILLGSHDWAGIWADTAIKTIGQRHYMIGGTPQQEYAMRSGVNMVLYALTGNYKADQVHVSHILERLGK